MGGGDGGGMGGGDGWCEVVFPRIYQVQSIVYKIYSIIQSYILFMI